MFRSRSFAFVVLFAGLGLRLLTQPRASFRLAGRLDIALRLFTFVAACAVLGPRFVAHPGALWLLAIAVTGAWLILFPLFVVDVRSRPLAEIRKHAHGAWLLVSVATARLAITAADLTDRTTWPGWLVLAAVAWILAVLLYVLITALIVRRAAARLAPEEVTPDSWILMGAPAVAALAGAHLRAALISQRSATGWADATRPAIFVLWVLASLWIPVLVYAQMWRMDHRPVSVQFTAPGGPRSSRWACTPPRRTPPHSSCTWPP